MSSLDKKSCIFVLTSGSLIALTVLTTFSNETPLRYGVITDLRAVFSMANVVIAGAFSTLLTTVSLGTTSFGLVLKRLAVNSPAVCIIVSFLTGTSFGLSTFSADSAALSCLVGSSFTGFISFVTGRSFDAMSSAFWCIDQKKSFSTWGVSAFVLALGFTSIFTGSDCLTTSGCVFVGFSIVFTGSSFWLSSACFSTTVTDVFVAVGLTSLTTLGWFSTSWTFFVTGRSPVVVDSDFLCLLRKKDLLVWGVLGCVTIFGFVAFWVGSCFWITIGFVWVDVVWVETGGSWTIGWVLDSFDQKKFFSLWGVCDFFRCICGNHWVLVDWDLRPATFLIAFPLRLLWCYKIDWILSL